MKKLVLGLTLMASIYASASDYGLSCNVIVTEKGNNVTDFYSVDLKKPGQQKFEPFLWAHMTQADCFYFSEETDDTGQTYIEVSQFNNNYDCGEENYDEWKKVQIYPNKDGVYLRQQSRGIITGDTEVACSSFLKAK